MVFFLLFLQIYFTNTLKESTNKCVNCKFYLKPIATFSSEFSKCLLYPKSELNYENQIKKKEKILLNY
jgi:hypothetical protein